MINLLITALGIALILGGLYAMSFGFYSPPNFPLFFIGLCISVLGAIIIIIFGSKANFADLNVRTPKKDQSKNNKNQMKSQAIPKEIKPKPSKKKLTLTKEESKETSNIKELVTSEKLKDTDKPNEIQKTPKKITPKRVGEENNPLTNKKIDEKTLNEEPKITPQKKPFIKTSGKEEIKPKAIMEKAATPSKSTKETDEQYVKNRLDRLKQNYIQNTKDIENLIEERLDSFKGTLDQIKSESKDPSIIWSFDAGDVQGTMKETILKADKKILMMYPWVRNIDVGVLKRFMETESKMIIQEASLDDDASVELIKLLMDNNVKIRTMPHVHTVAIVSDDDNGLIISTDPIYESFEVGVIYKDQKSIEEIERMFEEAWGLSRDINLEINN
jgi:hypothetical protein